MPPPAILLRRPAKAVKPPPPEASTAASGPPPPPAPPVGGSALPSASRAPGLAWIMRTSGRQHGTLDGLELGARAYASLRCMLAEQREPGEDGLLGAPQAVHAVRLPVLVHMGAALAGDPREAPDRRERLRQRLPGPARVGGDHDGSAALSACPRWPPRFPRRCGAPSGARARQTPGDRGGPGTRPASPPFRPAPAPPRPQARRSLPQARHD